MDTVIHQKLPNNWTEREKLRDKGQFWTPEWVANAMVAYVEKVSDVIFDPGVGMGVFYSALKNINKEKAFYGIDIDPEIILESKTAGILDNKSKVEIRDFILNPPDEKFKAIVANPPYIRHHRLSLEMKDRFRLISHQEIGSALDGRAGLHIYFLIQALKLLGRNGRLAFIMPADTCEGVFSETLWSWITKKYCLEGVVTFNHNASPFPRVDTNAIIFLISNTNPKPKIKWVKCLKQNTVELTKCLNNDFKVRGMSDLEIYDRSLKEALMVGLSREPRKNYNFEYTLSNFARVMRGVATGANEFFFLHESRVKELNIPDKFILSAVGRTRDIDGGYLRKKDMEILQKSGRPTSLFFPNGIPFDQMPKEVQNYIKDGERSGFPKRTLIATRKPWYKMEVREVPAFLFAYLGRRNARFIKNEAGAIPLTGFLCVYPRSNDKQYIKKLWQILQDPSTLENLKLVGKSYGSGAIKVEPRSLERLPIDSQLVRKIGLKPTFAKESLFD